MPLKTETMLCLFVDLSLFKQCSGPKAFSDKYSNYSPFIFIYLNRDLQRESPKGRSEKSVQNYQKRAKTFFSLESRQLIFSGKPKKSAPKKACSAKTIIVA